MGRLLRLLGSGSQAGGFSPLQLSGLVAWYDASDAATLFQDSAGTTPAVLDADPVGYWGDKSGNANHAVQAGVGTLKPALKLAIQNSKNVLRFDGGDWLTKATPAGAVSPTGASLYVVGARSGANAFAEMLVVKRSVSELRWTAAGNVPQTLKDAGGAALDYGSIVSGWHVYESVSSDAGNSIALTVDGLTEVTSTDSTTTVIDNIDIGARNGGTFFTGDLSEIIVCKAPLSAGQRASTLAYLKAKWGTP